MCEMCISTSARWFGRNAAVRESATKEGDFRTDPGASRFGVDTSHSLLCVTTITEEKLPNAYYEGERCPRSIYNFLGLQQTTDYFATPEVSACKIKLSQRCAANLSKSFRGQCLCSSAGRLARLQPFIVVIDVS